MTGWVTLIKSTTNTIPIYIMQTTLLPEKEKKKWLVKFVVMRYIYIHIYIYIYIYKLALIDF